MEDTYSIRSSVASHKMATPTAPTGAAKLRQLLADPRNMVVAPGVYDGLTARLALAAGFECLYMVSVDSFNFPVVTLHHAALEALQTSLANMKGDTKTPRFQPMDTSGDSRREVGQLLSFDPFDTLSLSQSTIFQERNEHDT